MTIRFLAGFVLLFGTLMGLAEIDGTGRLGLPIVAAVLLVALVVERVLYRQSPADGFRALGFGRPTGRSLAVVTAVCVPVLVVPWLLVGAVPTMRPGWPWLLLGIFAFHGLAEELVWRGYAYRRLREGRSFGRAVLLTMPLVAVAHVPVLVRSGVAVGLAALAVAAVTSIPFAHLWEMGRGTIWAPALLHTAIDAFKLVDVPADATVAYSLALAGVSIVVPLLALLVPRRAEAARPLGTPTRR